MFVHRKRLTMPAAPSARGSEEVHRRLPPASQDRAMMPAQLGRRVSFFLSGALCLANGDHELGLLTGESASADRAASAANLSKILTHFCRDGDAFVSH
jgi:hypothetical protein